MSTVSHECYLSLRLRIVSQVTLLSTLIVPLSVVILYQHSCQLRVTTPKAIGKPNRCYHPPMLLSSPPPPTPVGVGEQGSIPLKSRMLYITFPHCYTPLIACLVDMEKKPILRKPIYTNSEKITTQSGKNCAYRYGQVSG